MKLFSKAKSIPKQPDYDVISAIERENRIHDEGFNERVDRMLVDEFIKRNKDSEAPFSERIESMYDLFDSLYSTKYRLMVITMIDEARKAKWAGRGNPYEELKARMVERGKRRHD